SCDPPRSRATRRSARSSERKRHLLCGAYSTSCYVESAHRCLQRRRFHRIGAGRRYYPLQASSFTPVDYRIPPRGDGNWDFVHPAGCVPVPEGRTHNCLLPHSCRLPGNAGKLKSTSSCVEVCEDVRILRVRSAAARLNRNLL